MHNSYKPDSIPGLPYCCGKCGAQNVRLWRRYQVFLEDQDLFCVECAEEDQGRMSNLLTDGQRGEGDQIGWLIPAVPTADGTDSFWGYSSVPQEGVEWWYSLPMREKGGTDAQ